MNVNLEQFLAWDLETVPKQDFNKEHPLWDTWKNKNRKEDLTEDELLDKFSKEGGLYGEYLTIVCLSCAFIHNGEIRIKSFTGTEKEIIDEFLKVAAYIFNNKGGVISLGHNVQNFDVPVLRKCYSRYYPMFTLPDYISDINTKGKLPFPEKPWVLAERFFDTLQLQKGGNYMFSSMAETAINIGIPTPKIDTDGSMVAEIFRQGDINRIIRYCEGDVLTSLKIAFSWLGFDMLPIAGENNQEELVMVEQPLLKRLYMLQSFTSELKDEVKALCDKKKLTAKDKKNLRTILLGIMGNDDFEMGKQDTKAQKQEKETEVDEFIKSL